MSKHDGECSRIDVYVLLRMGTDRMDYKQLSQQIELKTGAMIAGPHLAEHCSNSGLFEQVCNLFLFCLYITPRNARPTLSAQVRRTCV